MITISLHKSFGIKLGRKETVPPVPLHNTTKAVGALTLHTGVRNRRMELTGKKMPATLWQDSPPLWYVMHHKYTYIFIKNKSHLKN